MGADENTFTNQRIGNLLFKFAVPAILSLLANELYNMVSTVFAGRYIGANAIGALTVEFPIQRFFIALGLLIAIGTSTYTARMIGQKNIIELKKIIVNSFTLTLISLIFISGLVFIFRNPILFALGASQETYYMANTYVSIVLFGTVFQALSVVACYIMVSFGQTKMMLYTDLISVSINIVINYILVTVMGMGIEGSAIAVVITQVVSLIFVSSKFININRKLKIRISDKFILESIDIDTLNEIIIGGFSTFVVEISDAVVSAVLNNLLYATGGDSAIIIVGIVAKISMFLYITMIGISYGMQPIVGYNFGAGNYKKVKETLKVSLKYVVIISSIFWAVFVYFSNDIIGFFLKDNVLLGQTVSAFKICALMFPLLGIYYIIMYYYQAIGEAKKSFLLSIYREMLVFIPLAIFLTKVFGVKGAVIAYPITDVLVIITSVHFIRKALKERFEENNIVRDFKRDAYNNI
ncbi:MATE family efflux transporter [Clostridium fermenticellae]|uniref:Multidrug export protein MepA n=1 Tax=Clostridium fermenticellae TaxID=2068654 RepID=A0A386H6F6_9CLOT|nr:MATE family efflux transporter [Clostridium fermenticellae]AYD41158.1 MATE family efflux transporter [Clostridium fermenticellae]